MVNIFYFGEFDLIELGCCLVLGGCSLGLQSNPGILIIKKKRNLWTCPNALLIAFYVNVSFAVDWMLTAQKLLNFAAGRENVISLEIHSLQFLEL